MRFGVPIDERAADGAAPARTRTIRHRDHRRRLRHRATPTARWARRWPGSTARRYRLVGHGRPRLRTTASGREPRATRASPTRAARPGRVRRLPARGGRGSLERCGADRVRRAAAAQPRPHRLLLARCLGGDVGAPRDGPGGRDRRRAGAGQRLHARRRLVPGAVRRPDRLGDADPEPVRAVARPAGAARRASATACASSRGSSTTAGSSGTTCPTRTAWPARPPRVPPGRLDRGRARAARPDAARSPSGTA